MQWVYLIKSLQLPSVEHEYWRTLNWEKWLSCFPADLRPLLHVHDKTKALGQESQSVHPLVSISPSQLWEEGLWRSGVTWPGSQRSIALLGTERRSSGSAHFYGFLCCCFRRGLVMFSLLYSSGTCWESSQDNCIPQQLLAVLHLCLKTKTNKIQIFGACSETLQHFFIFMRLSAS